MRFIWMSLITLIIAFGAWWIVKTPPKEIKIGGPAVFNAIPQSITLVTSADDYIANSVEKSAQNLPPYDEVILNEDESIAYIPAKDGVFWRVDLKTGKAEPFVDVPLMAAGARTAPNDDDIIYFCSSYLYGEEYPNNERVGLYQLNVKTKAVMPLVLDVPISEQTGGDPIVYLASDRPMLKNNSDEANNSRALTFCNDLDVSADGQRIYFTEPFSYGKPQMGGGGTYREAVSLGQNGRVWLYDMTKGETSLIAQNFVFPDGILIENAGTAQNVTEESILVSETVKFSIVRMFINGDKAGQFETVWKDLPGMPDGMDRDSEGKIWVGILKQRSSTIDKIHMKPWIKPFLLRLPSSLMPVSLNTSILALSADGETALFYSEHDGSVLSDISVVVPGKDGLYLAAFGPDSNGLYQVPYPNGLQPQ